MLKNPFGDYGGVVSGARFIGRNREIEIIQNRLLGCNYGNIAIMGLPRIGKSSLAWNSIITLKEKLIHKKILPVWISFGEYSSLNDVFQEVFLELLEMLADSNELVAHLASIIKSFNKASNQIESRRFIKKTLKYLKSNGFRLILVLDEFDNAQNILDLHDFQFLRETSNNPDTKLALLTISRKTIQELEPDNGTLSNFYQIFTDLRLKLFNQNDQDDYWNRVRQNGIEVSQKYISLTKYYCGSHPYLLDAFNHEVFNKISQTETNLEKISELVIKELNLKMLNEYESIIKLMRDEGLERMLMQMIVGPVYDITQRDVEKLLKYDIVSMTSTGKYSSFSEYFNNYLLLKSNTIDIWPLWSEVENEIRLIIKMNIAEKYGDHWEDLYIKQNKQRGGESFIQDKRDMKLRNKKSFGEKASDHLVDYTYPMDMFDRFIALDWSWYSAIFDKQKNDWKPIFEHLGKIRNPLAHNNPNFLSDSDRNIAEGYCKVILERINKWKTKDII
jgi:hypothetical protein